MILGSFLLRLGFAKLPRIKLEFGPTNITALAQQLQLDVVVHLALEFAIRRHLTVEISGSAHLHPRVPRVPRPYRYKYIHIKNSYLKLRPRR